tara:strand:+ start:1051 stop:1806 length:756 start_codon:yes stop_codon:yes gene_type:complete
MKNKGIKILPLKDCLIDDEMSYNPILPRITRNRGFNMIIMGATNCGKTCFINNLLLSKNCWGGKKNAFEEVYFFSPSVNLDDSCRFIKEHFITFDEYKDEYLEEIMDKQKEKPNDEMDKILIVIDDAVGTISKNQASLINKFSSRYRHFNSNLMFSVQSWRALSSVIRVNAGYMAIFRVPNIKELEKINEEVGGIFRDRLIAMYIDATREDYGFLYLNLRSNPPRAYKNFDSEYDYRNMEITSIKEFVKFF